MDWIGLKWTGVDWSGGESLGLPARSFHLGLCVMQLLT